MVERKVAVSFCGALLLLAVGWSSAGQGRVAASGKGDESPSWERVNLAARKMKAGDAMAAGALADAVFAHHRLDSEVSMLIPTMKDRLVQSEVDFQNGKHKGITEENVASAVNDLADRFGAPDYAHTDVQEVKRLRVRMLTLFPGLIGRGSAATRDDSKPHFDAVMSPIEAFHITATLIHQKVFNPEFQLSQREKTDESLQQHSGDSVRARGNSQGERSREMLNLVHQRAASMSLTEVFNQCGHSLDLLGIGGETR